MRNKYKDTLFEQDLPDIVFPIAGLILSTLTVIAIVAYFILFGQGYTSRAVVKEIIVSEKVIDTVAAEELKKVQVKISEQTTFLTGLAALRGSIAGLLIEKLEPLKLDLVVNSATGNIRFNDGLVFETNIDLLNQKGQDNLLKFFPVYIKALTEGKYKDYIDGIIVEGHADDGGSYILNLQISEKRALNTIAYIIEQKLVSEDIIDKYIMTSGRAFTQPVLINGNIEKNLSRRVEFSFKLKEDKFMQDILKALK